MLNDIEARGFWRKEWPENMQKIFTFDPAKNKQVLVGAYDIETKSFLKPVKPYHFMYKTQSYAIQENVMEALQAKGCLKIIISTATTDWMSDFKDWLAPDIKVLDYGNGKQRHFPLKRMTRVPLKKDW